MYPSISTGLPVACVIINKKGKEHPTLYWDMQKLFEVKGARSKQNALIYIIVIDQFPRFVCSIEARILGAKPEG